MNTQMDKTDQVLAIEACLSEEQRAAILAHYERSNWHGADVADILDMLSNYDAYLGVTEPMYEDHAEEIEALEHPRLATLCMLALYCASAEFSHDWYAREPVRPEWADVSDLIQRVIASLASST